MFYQRKLDAIQGQEIGIDFRVEEWPRQEKQQIQINEDH
jgi:hypothetical protein